MNFHDLHYTFPQAAYLLLVIIALLFLLWRLFRYRKQVLEQFAAPSILKTLTIARSQRAFLGRSFCLCLAWVALTIALMQPAGYGYYPKNMSQSLQNRMLAGEPIPHLVILLIDASASMTVPDSHNQSRFNFAKEIADEIVARLSGERVAMHAFTSDVTQLIPQTYNYLYLRIAIKQLQINEGGTPGTNIAEALKEIRERYYPVPTPLLKTVIMLTDGGDTYLETLQGPTRKQEIDLMLNLVGNAEQNHLRVFTIGLGTLKGAAVPDLTYEGKSVISALDEELLRKISQRGRGQYYRANDFSPQEIASDLVGRMQQDLQRAVSLDLRPSSEKSAQAQENLAHDLYYQIYLGIAILLLAFAILIPSTQESR